jgi:hypothetical protein
MRWTLVFALVAVAAMYVGARSTVPTATAQDYQIIDQDNGTVEPRLVEPQRGPFQDRPGPGPMMQMGPQMMGPPPAVAMWGDDKHLFILRGDRVFKLQKDNLKIVAETRLPMDEPMRPPREGVLREGPGRLEIELDPGERQEPPTNDQGGQR